MSRFRYQYGFIGMGNMGYAILKGILKHHAADEILFAEHNQERGEDVSAQTGVASAESNCFCAEHCHYLILAVKPQQLDGVIDQIRPVVTSDHIIISIAPGITVADLKARFGKECRIVRAMPNTPALVGEGMTGVCCEKGVFDQQEMETIRQFFLSFGKMVLVDEKLMDTVVCASGSSPAYVYLFIEALADSVVKYGMSRKEAYELVAQTVLGSAKMVLETGEHPGRLKDQVCSPGGTTIAGIAALEEWGMRNSLIKATDACYEKCSRIK